jgi:predicted RNA binding protein YcfA (HicA-like mRNA interferase family)
MPKLRAFSGAELCNFLSEHGFERVRQRGSHVIMRRGQVSLPVPRHATRNGARGMSDMHGNAARVAESEPGGERMNYSSKRTPSVPL